MIRNILLGIVLFIGITSYGQYTIPFNKSVSGVRVHTNTYNELSLSVNYAGINQRTINTSKGVFSELVLDGAYRTGNVGEPQLPSTKKLIQVPEGAKVSIEVLAYESADYNLEHNGIYNKLLPYQPSYSKSVDPSDQEFVYKEDEYLKDEFSNIELAQVELLGKLRGVNLAQITINPVKYNPTKNTLRVYNNIEVKVYFDNPNISKTKSEISKSSSPYFGTVQNLLVNASNEVKTSFDSNPDHTKYPIKYLIVTAPEFESQLSDFVLWKTQKGFDVVMVTTDDIGASASEIKTWIHNQYNAATEESPAPTFLLLVGDTGQIPASQYGDATGKATDLYYACVDGDDDIFPDMYYGRFSAQTTDQLQNMLDKVLYYEKYEFADPTYLNDITLIAGADASYNTAVAQPTINYGTENYFNSVHGFSTVNKYLSSYTGCYDDERFQVSMINYTAHCSEINWQSPALSQSGVNAMSNENKYPLAIGNCCLSADFGYSECIGETWMRKANGGAVAYIGSSPESYWYEDFYWSVGAHAFSSGNYPTFDASTLGAYDAPYESDYLCVDALVFVGNLAVTEAHDQNYTSSVSTKYYWEGYNCLSDPSLAIFLTEASDNTVSHLETMPIGVSEYEVTAEAGSYVGISKDSILHGAALVPESGTVTISINPIATVGDVDIVVTKAQYKPYITSVPAVTLDGPYLTLKAFDIIDASGDGEVQVGEEFNIDLTIKNVGSTVAQNVTASITSSDDYVDVINNNIDISFGNIGSDTIAKVSGRFNVVIKDSVPDQHIVSFYITMTDDAGNYETTKTVRINAPELLVLDDFTIIDTAENKNGILDAGEQTIMQVSIVNIGSAQVSSNVQLSLPTANPYINIISDTYVSNIGIADTVLAEFIIEADAITPQGTPVDLLVEARGGETLEYEAENNFDLIVGEIPEVIIGNESSVAALYPFNNYYENNKTQILYLSSEINSEANAITDLSFDISAATSTVSKRDLKNFSIKLLQTTQETTTNFVDMTEAVTVFERTVYNLTGSAGWELFEFDEVFSYDGSSNLLVEVLWGDNGEYASSTDRTKVNCSPTTNTTVAYGYSDTQTPPSLGETTNIRPNVLMHFGVAHTLTFEVLDQSSSPIENALISINGIEKITNESGIASFVYAGEQYDLNYTVNAYAYYEGSGTIDLDSEMVTESLALVAKPKYDITFHVTNEGNNLENASVDFNDEIKVTDAAGLVTYSQIIEDTDFVYKVTKNDFVAVSDTIDADATKTISVSMVDNILTPVLASVKNKKDGQALLSWSNVHVLNFEDGFEEYDDWARAFGTYTLVDGDELSVYGSSDCDFPDENTATAFRIMNYTQTSPQWNDIMAYSGNKVAASFCANSGSSPNSAINDDWLITPQISVGSSYEFSFYAKSLSDEWGLERFRVAVSTLSVDTADFTIISEGLYIEAPTTWTEYSFDLSDYFGQNIYIAIQCVSADAFVFMVDDLKCSPSDNKSGEKVFDGYEVYLNNLVTPIASNVQDLEYLYSGLSNGETYTAGVKSIYTSGSSEVVSREFIYQQLYTTIFNVTAEGALIQDAEIIFNNETVLTDVEGNGSINAEFGLTPQYTISYEGYYLQNGNISVTNDTTLYFNLVAIPDVTFIISDKDGYLLNGAEIVFNNDSLYTDANGQVVFENVKANESLVYHVNMDAYLSFTDTIKITNNDTLIETSIPELPEINFVIKDIDNAAVEGVNVFFNNREVVSNSSGIALFENVEPQSNGAVRVESSLYLTHYDTIETSLTNQTVEIIIYKIPTLTLILSNGTNLIEGAGVEINGDSLVSDNNGQIIIEGIVSGTYPYLIHKEGYFTYSDTVEIYQANVNENIVLAIVPDVLFKVKHNGLALENVLLNFGDLQNTSNISGEVLFTNIQKGNYNYLASSEGYYTQSGTCVVGDSNVFKTIELKAIPDVTLTVSDGSELLADAKVTLDTISKFTNSNGEVEYIDVEAGKYTYTVECDKYFTKTDTLTVDQNNINEVVILEHESYAVIFNIAHQGDPLANAAVTFNGEVKYSNGLGEVIFSNIEVGYSYDYTIIKEGFYTHSGYIDVVNKAINEHVGLTLISYNVLFTISDKNGVLEGAMVYFNNDSIETNSLGTALFENVVPANNLTYLVFKSATHNNYKGEVNVDGNENISVSLSPVAISQNSNAVVVLYPNPTKGVCYVNVGCLLSNLSLDIVDAKGRLVYKLSEVKAINKIDLSKESKGVYFIHIRGENVNFTKQLILE